MKKHFENSEDLCKYISKINNGTCIMSFSCGIDSIAMYYQLEKYFDNIIPIYLYVVPNLDFVNRYLNYFEDKWGRKIIRMPHPRVIMMLRENVFRTLDLNEIDDSYWDNYDYTSLCKIASKAIGIGINTMRGIGLKKGDNPSRHMSITKYGSVNYKTNSFYPIYDWNDAKVKGTIRDNNCKVPVDYKIFGRSYDGLGYRFTVPIKKYFPSDYEKLKEYFDLIDVEIKRYVL